MISGKCFSPSDTPYGKDGAKSGSGGGVVLSGILFRIKGNGGDGLVLIEWGRSLGSRAFHMNKIN